MTDPFSARLAAAVAATGAPVCVGLDPDPARLPAPHADGSAQAAGDFCVAIVGATAAHAAAFKPNLAFFEAYGSAGWAALERVSDAVRQSGRLLVVDGKRGDIGNTGRRYAAAQYDGLGADAVTVAPYMGADSVVPFLEHPGRCAFVLVATSNPGAADLQRLYSGGLTVSDVVAEFAAGAAASAPGEVGFVVGATRPALLAEVRDGFPPRPVPRARGGHSGRVGSGRDGIQ